MTSFPAVRPRSDRSFQRLYERHAGDVYRYALALVRERTSAEDVTRTTFVNARALLDRGERPRSARSWLIDVAHEVCRERSPTREVDPGGRLVGEEDYAPTERDVRRALGHLELDEQAALLLREVERRSCAEIADVLAMSPSAVETLIFRARRALREELETSLTCGEAELAISRQLDDLLDRVQLRALRDHLLECDPCATFLRRQRAHRGALRALAGLPLPPSLAPLALRGRAN